MMLEIEEPVVIYLKALEKGNRNGMWDCSCIGSYKYTRWKEGRLA